MAEMLSSVLTSLKNTSPEVLLGLAFASSVLLFTDEPFVATLGVDAFRASYKPYIGSVFIGSLSILAAYSVFKLGRCLKKPLTRHLRQISENRATRRLQKTLHDLTPDEKAYLGPYILESKNTQYFPMADGISWGLSHKHIIYSPSPMGDLIKGVAFNLQPWAKNYLEDHPELLDGATPDMPRRGYPRI